MNSLGAFGVVCLGAIAIAIVAPLLGRGDRRLLVGVVLGLSAIAFVAASTVGGFGTTRNLAAATGILALFGLGLAGASRALPGGATPFLVAGTGIALLASPFLVDAWLESTSGAARPAALFLALELNPLAAIASPLLDVDWLRQSVIYGEVRLGAFHRFGYPSPVVQAAGWAVVSLMLAAPGNHRLEST